MNTQNRKTARRPLKSGGWHLGATALCLVVLSLTLWSCGSPVGGTESNSVEFFVGKEYKSQYGELFKISARNTIELGFGNSYSTKGRIAASRRTDSGTVYLLECSTHSNYSSAQYPDFNEQNPHSGCYLLLYVRSITAQTVEWGQFASKTGATGEGQYGTSCFSSASKAKAEEYLDLSRWSPQPMLSTGSAQN